MSGVEFSTIDLAASLPRSKWDPVVVCPEEGDLSKKCQEAGIAVSFVPMRRSFSTSARIAGKTLINPLAFAANFVSLVSNAFRLARYLQDQNIGIIITKGMHAHYFAGAAARLAGIPCVWHVQDRVSERYGPIFRWMLSAGGRILAQHCIVDADSIARQLRTFNSQDRISVVWNGVDTRKFSPSVSGSSVRREWGADRRTVLVGVVARLTPWKGQHLLVEACSGLIAHNPNLKVVLVGTPMFDDDNYLERLRRDAQASGLEGSIIFAGFRWDLPEVFAALDIVAHTSIEKDSTPLAVVSAMAAGKPIVCSRVEGTAELFDEGRDALLFPPGDVELLHQSLERLLSDPALATRLGRAARDKAVKHLSLELFTKRCESVLSGVVR